MTSWRSGGAKLNVTDYVFDASAILALILQEQGKDAVEEYLMESRWIASVNLAEIVTKLVDYAYTDADISESLGELGLDVVDFDGSQALEAGRLRKETRGLGLSLGDRACLAVAMAMRCPAITADRTWQSLALPIQVYTVR